MSKRRNMSEELLYRRHISRQHLEVLAQYMERYPALALSSARSREGHIQSRRMWEKIARTLNRIDESISKNGRSWSRYWADLKFKMRRKYSVIQKCHNDGAPCSINLSPWEKRMMKILTDKDGNLLPTASVYHQANTFHPMHYPMMGTGKSQLVLLKPTENEDAKIEDSGGLEESESVDYEDEHLQDDYLDDTSEVHTEHITLPTADVKPHMNSFQNDSIVDPIEVCVSDTEDKKSIDDLRRELVEFELNKQKELFEMEKQFKREKHEAEMSILNIKKQMMMKELKKS